MTLASAGLLLGWLLALGLAGLAWHYSRKVRHSQQQQQQLQTTLDTALLRDQGRLNIIENLPVALFMLGKDASIIRANRNARALLGSPDPAGTPFSSHIRQHDILEAINVAHYEQRQTGTACWLENNFYNVLAQPIPANPGSQTRLALVLHDVTAQKRLEQANRNFMANASHELRTPLTALLGFIETLQTSARDDPEALEHFLPIMHHEASRMQNLVKDLLALARLQREADSAADDPVPLTTLLKQEIDSLTLQARQKDIVFDTDIQADVTVKGQNDDISQMLQNLLENAVKYGQPGSAVSVALIAPVTMPDNKAATARQQAAAQLSITNQGPGIAEKDLARVTERFFRTAAARESGVTGTGLGLAIVKHTVARYHGKLEISSSLAGPTTFRVWLPLIK